MSSNNAIQSFNESHPIQELSRAGTEDIFQVTKSNNNSAFLDQSLIDQLENDRPNTAASKSKKITFLDKISNKAHRAVSPNVVTPLAVEETPEPKENRESQKTPEILEIHNNSGDEGFQETTFGPNSLIDPQKETPISQDKEDQNDVLYLVTHTNKKYIPLQIAREHVNHLVQEISTLKEKHNTQISILKKKIIETAKYAQDLKNRPAPVAQRFIFVKVALHNH